MHSRHLPLDASLVAPVGQGAKESPPVARIAGVAHEMDRLTVFCMERGVPNERHSIGDRWGKIGRAHV